MTESLYYKPGACSLTDMGIYQAGLHYVLSQDALCVVFLEHDLYYRL